MTSKEFAQRLSRRAKRVRLQLRPDLVDALWVYFELLFRWNEKINLTSFSLEASDEAIDRLLIEPLLVVPLLRGPSVKLMDIGSGGGSPAIPLALATYEPELVMVESKARKCAFLREAMRRLALAGSVESARFEELLSRSDFHEAFDYLSLRAVRTELRTLHSLQAFLRPGGRLLLFKTASKTRPDVVPPLRWMEAQPLTPGSELQVLEKLRIP